MTFKINKIFMPSIGVELVFNLNSLTPNALSSIIYDIDYTKKEIIIAQPLSPLLQNTSFEELHLTTISRRTGRRLRLGIECIQFKLINNYHLANATQTQVVRLEYKLPIKEINIRSAFRLPLSTKYTIKARIFLNKLEYTSPHGFVIIDVSLTGFGLKIPKHSPLLQIKNGKKLLIGVTLLNMSIAKPMGTFPLVTKIIRRRPHFSKRHILMGVKILNLKSAHETILNKFIHEAQIDELKRLSRKKLWSNT